MDVIAVRRLDELHRLRHIDSLNTAFGHEWQYSDFALKVRPYGATSFKVSMADDRGEAIYSARYVFNASEYDEQFRPASLSSRSWSRSLSVDAPILAAQSIFWWKEVK